jgi:competence/damage-inducible protein CinA-like protein
MPAAEIITIGTELLLGESVDTNTRYIARALRDEGVDMYRSSTVGDNKDRIAEIIQEGLGRAEIIITTGGLGPTVDDPTREAVASALGLTVEFRPELWEQIQRTFQRYGITPTENNKRQAYIPQGALSIENDVGTAPAFIVEMAHQVVIALPGVPREMEHLLDTKVLPYLRKRFDLQELIKTRVLHTAGVGESQIDARIGDLEQLNNPTVGMAAHAGQVDVRITAKADSQVKADKLIQEVETELRDRLGQWIYGANGQTLEAAAIQAVAARGWKVAVVEANLGGRLLRRFAGEHQTFAGGEVLAAALPPEELATATKAARQRRGVQVGLGVLLIPDERLQTMYLVLETPRGTHEVKRTYGGPPQLAQLWTTNLSLDFLRKLDL